MSTKPQSPLNGWVSAFRTACPQLGIIVVGVTGSGKSSLINNLLGKEVAKVGGSVYSETNVITGYEGEINGVPVKIYDTPGLLDTKKGKDKIYFWQIMEIVKTTQIHVVIYCFKMNETRLKQTFVQTFKMYNKIGLNWERTLFALTFADGVTASKQVKKEPGFDMKIYFDERTEEWCTGLKAVLRDEVDVPPRALENIKVSPTSDDPDELLPNGKPWFIPLWLKMLALLPPYAMVRFLDIHKENIAIEGEEIDQSQGTQQIPSPPAEGLPPQPVNPPEPIQPPQPPQASPQPLQPPAEAESTPPVRTERIESTSTPRPVHKIVLTGKDREEFEETVGKKMQEGISGWETVKTVGAVAAGATAITAAAAVTAVAAPVVAAGALVALPFVAVGAAVAGIFKLVKRKTKK